MSKELKALIFSAKMLCEKDSNILIRVGKSERACQFRIAKYLSECLEKDGLFIDCEFNKLGNITKTIIDNGESHDVIPDIIYHDRNFKNLCVIEIKMYSTINYNSYFSDDRIKVQHIMKDLCYTHGYCVSDIHINGFTIHIINKRNRNTRKIIFNNQNSSWSMRIERDHF